MDVSDLPIDINTSKLLEWLISRHHVKKSWQDDIPKVREKLNIAIRDMPEHPDIADILLSGCNINYFHCSQIVEILKTTEADTKNVFGSYGSQRMRDWQEVMRLYERDGFYLAEAAHTLMHSVRFDIPGIKRKIAKLEQQQQDCDKRIQELHKSERTTNNELVAQCRDYGVSGDSIERELKVKSAAELPKTYERTVEALPQVLTSMKLYSDFQNFLKGVSEPGLQLLQYVLDKGNTTCYEFIHKIEPISVARHPLDVLPVDDEDSSDVIDFSVEEVLDAGAEEVNFDLDNWEIETVDTTDEGISLELSNQNLPSGPPADGVARGQESLYILDDPEHRNRFLNELTELEFFLKMRKYEMGHKKVEINLSSMLDQLPVQSEEEIDAMLASVHSVLAIAKDRNAVHLHNARHSKQYVEMIGHKIQQMRNALDRVKAKIEEYKEQCRQVNNQLQEIRPQLVLLLDYCKTLQSQIEADISKRYNGRPVHLIGGATAL